MTDKKIAFKTLGCRLNQYETDALASEFKSAGYKIVDFRDKPNVYIVNSCTVTHQSDSKSRKIMHQALRNDDDAIVVMTGCTVNNHKDYIEKYPDVTYFVENENKNSIFSLIDAHLKGEIVSPDHLNNDVFGYKPADSTFHTRSLIKIQDGCDNFCTFCIIPTVRGRAVSRPVKDVLENIKHVIDFGYREIVLTGVNIGRYEYEGVNFEELTERILELPGDFRVRITSIEPDGYGDRFFEMFNHPKLAPHLHLCLQSGSDSVLKKMKRMYTVGQFREITEKIRKVRNDFNFTTDILVGFPGETEKEFLESCSVAEELGFSHIHTFKYSIRSGTRAAKMSDQINEEIKTRRSEIIRKISDINKLSYYSSMIGKTQRLLVEDVNNGYIRGYGEYYVPMIVKADGILKNDMVTVRMSGIGEGDDAVGLGELV